MIQPCCPPSKTLAPLRDVARLFGDDFATPIDEARAGTWTAPSSHRSDCTSCWFRREFEPYLPKLAEVRPLVEREFLNERRKAELQALYDRLSKKYAITLEKSVAAPTASAVPAGSAAR